MRAHRGTGFGRAERAGADVDWAVGGGETGRLSLAAPGLQCDVGDVMNASLLRAGHEGAPWMLQALILYDNLKSGRRAKGLLDRVAERSGGEVQLRLELWRFDLLALMEAVEASRAQARGTDLVVVAYQAGRALPAAVLSWLAWWGGCGQAKEAALVAVIGREGRPPTEPCPATVALRTWASHHGVELLCEHAGTGGAEDWNLTGHLARAEHLMTPTLESILRARPPVGWTHWGLNE